MILGFYSHLQHNEVLYHHLKSLLLCEGVALFFFSNLYLPAILSPQVYFIVFLIVLILWGLYKSIGPQFGYARILLLAFTGSHILLLHLYQFQFFQEVLAPSDLISRWAPNDKLLWAKQTMHIFCLSVSFVYSECTAVMNELKNSV